MWDAVLNQELPDFIRDRKSDLEAILQPLSGTAGLTGMQIRILYEIHNNKASNIGSLSRLMGRNHGNCSSLCKKLEQAGFVERRRSQRDERMVTLYLTDRGDLAVAAVVSQIDEKLAPVLAAISPEKLEVMRQGMWVMEELLRRCTLCVKEG